MSFRNTATQFGSVSKTLHWIISPLVILMLIIGFFMDDISAPSLRMAVFNIHKLTGIFILILMLVRLLWAFGNSKPVSPKGTSRFEHIAEWTVHFSLYAMIIAQPLSGWIGSVAAGHAPHLGGMMLNLPVEISKPFAHACFRIHSILAIVILSLLLLHILAALYHHFVLKDNVLRRMMPGG